MEKMGGTLLDDLASGRVALGSEVLDDPLKLLDWLEGEDPEPAATSPVNKRPGRPVAKSKARPVATSPIVIGPEGDLALLKLTPTLERRIRENGISTIDELSSMRREELTGLSGIGLAKARTISNALKAYAEKTGQKDGTAPSQKVPGEAADGGKAGEGKPKAEKSAVAKGPDGHRLPEIQLLDEAGLTYFDYRPKGRLWIVAGAGMTLGLKKRLRALGLDLAFDQHGPACITKGRPTWYTRDASGPQQSSEPERASTVPASILARSSVAVERSLPTLPAEKTLQVDAERPELAIIERAGFAFVDNRDRSGALWVIAGLTARHLAEELDSLGIKMRFRYRGSKTTGGAPGWWTKDRYCPPGSGPTGPEPQHTGEEPSEAPRNPVAPGYQIDCPTPSAQLPSLAGERAVQVSAAEDAPAPPEPGEPPGFGFVGTLLGEALDEGDITREQYEKLLVRFKRGLRCCPGEAKNPTSV